MRQTQALAVFAAVILAAAKSDGATVAWGTPVTISGNTDVITTGTLDCAFAMGSVSTPTVNGVLFSAFSTNANPVTVGNTTLSSSGNITNGIYTSVSAPFSSLPVPYRTLLGSGAFRDGATLTLTLNGLTIGRDYLFQTWANDPRGGGFGTRQGTVTSGNAVVLDYNVSTLAGGLGEFAVGTFTADGTNQVFVYTSATSAQINAFQLRDVTPVPETSHVLAVAAAALAVLGFARRRRRPATST